MVIKQRHTKILQAGVFALAGIFIAFPLSAQEHTLYWQPFEEAIRLAEEHEKPVLVDIWAPWCGWCKKMQKEVYPELAEILNQEFILTRLNRDDNETDKRYQNISATPLRLAQKLNIQSVPAIVLLSSEGKYLFHISGFTEADKLEAILEFALNSPEE